MEDKNLWQRLIAVSNEVDALQKDTTVGSGRYSYKGISHDSVIRSCKGALAKNGVLALASVAEHTEDVLESVTENGSVKYQHKSAYTVCTTFINADKPEEREEVRTRGIGIDSLDKSAGKAQSYAKKYALMMALQMFTDDGDETRLDEPHGRPAKRGSVAPEPATDKQIALLDRLRAETPLSDEQEAEMDAYLKKGSAGGIPAKARASARPPSR